MNPNIIVALAIIGYIVISAVIMGLAERKQNDFVGSFAFVWPILLVVLAIFAVGYFPYRIANGSFRRKEK